MVGGCGGTMVGNSVEVRKMAQAQTHSRHLVQNMRTVQRMAIRTAQR